MTQEQGIQFLMSDTDKAAARLTIEFEPHDGEKVTKADIFISRYNQTHGPYPRDVIEDWIAKGKINRHDVACTDKTGWQPVAKLLWPDEFARATRGLTGKQWSLIIAAIVGFVVIAAIANNSNNQQRSSTATANQSSTYQPTTESPKDAALRQVSIDFKWSKGGFGSVMLADFTITNRSNYTVKDLDVTCTHYANSGTEIDRNSRTIYETVPANGKKILRNFNMGFIHTQAAQSSCKITDLVVQ